MPSVKPVPEGFHTITPHLVVRDAKRAIDFYKKAFGAEETNRNLTPDGKVMHAALKIGDSIVFLADEFPGSGCTSPQSLGGTAITLHIYVDDVDKLWNRAVSAGAQIRMALSDTFWGDRYGQVSDPFGHSWSLATRKENLSSAEVEKRAQAFFADQAAKRKSA